LDSESAAPSKEEVALLLVPGEVKLAERGRAMAQVGGLQYRYSCCAWPFNAC
jgi:hypothetical protein